MQVESSELGTKKCAWVYWDAGQSDLEVFEFSVGWLHHWVSIFRRLGIPVTGAEVADLRTWRGFFNELGWGVYTIILGIGMFVVIDLTRRFSPGDLFRNLLLYALFMKAVGWGIWVWKRIRNPQGTGTV